MTDSAADLPAPLVPAYVDIRDFEFMPLSVQRLRDSAFASRTSGEEFRAGLLLWAASWHQVPASSVQDDDIELAALAGFGRVVKEWKKVKKAALYGFVRCSDGRLYHPVVAEKAIEAWNGKQEHAWRKECDRIRKDNKAREERGETPKDFPPRPVALQLSADGFPPEAKPVSAGNPDEIALKGKGQGKGEGYKKETSSPSSVSVTATEPGPGCAGDDDGHDPEPKTGAKRIESPKLGLLSPPETDDPVVLNGRAIGRAFSDAQEEVYGKVLERISSPLNEMRTAQRWFQELGVTAAVAREMFVVEMRDGQERGRSPIKSLAYFDKIIRAANGAGGTEPPAGSQGAQPVAAAVSGADVVRQRWRVRIRALLDSDIWADNWGPKPGEPLCEAPRAALEEFETELRAKIPGFAIADAGEAA